MKTISQVAELTGISTRTLQYYDEIGLLKPSELTPSGYRLYGDQALQRLQQILFFKELDFKLKDIRDILQQPDFDTIEAFRRQKNLLVLKRERLDRLIGLLEQLERGEQCMSFKEFDLSEYVEALEQFKLQNTADVIEHWGSVENFNHFIQKVRDDESHLARLAIKEFGSVEAYTEAMKHNLAHFSELMAHANELAENKEALMEKNNRLQASLAADLTRDVASEEVQDIVRQIVEFTLETSSGMDLGSGYWDIVVESFSNEKVREFNDKNYGPGASDYMARAIYYYFHKSERPGRAGADGETKP